MPPSNILTQLRLARLPQTSTSLRHFSRQSPLAYPRKDSQDKDSINTEATEYSKSGTDDQSASNEDAAFNPDVTSPEGEKDLAGKGKGKGNPLDVSPANQEVSKQRGEQEGGAQSGGGDGETRSGFGSGKKNGS